MSLTQSLSPDTTGVDGAPEQPAPRQPAASPHRRSLRRLLLVGGVLLLVPTTMVLLSLRGGSYADDSWRALLMLAVLAVAYLVSRRLLLTLLIGAVTLAIVSWLLAPDLADTRAGDATVLAHLEDQAGAGMLAGLHDVAVAEVDLSAARHVRLAGIGADDQTRWRSGR
jgi:hypothetical protein